jgi:acetate kinase
VSLILVLNTGSSSVKFAAFALPDLSRVLAGEVEPLGPSARLTIRADGQTSTHDLADGAGADPGSAVATILDEFIRRDLPVPVAVGHRVVHGGPDFTKPVVVDDASLAALSRLEGLAPLHQPHNLAGVRAAMAAFPGVPQIACFDTAFHRGHPAVEDVYALPHDLHDQGVRRYGFHGLSFDNVSRRLAALAPDVARGRVVIAHLGSGASMCGLRDGRSVATTMGFSALDGLPMATRSGQIDPGVLLWLMQEKGYDVPRLTDLLYRQSGLKGLSGLSGDMRVLLASPEPRARLAVDHFVARCRREIGGLAAVLEGLDGLVFTGGIGEHAAPIRAAITERSDWLGVEIDAASNESHALRISTNSSRVGVFVIPTDEEGLIASETARLTGG